MTVPELLELETRRAIYNLVFTQPGLHLREIQRQLGMHVNLVELPRRPAPINRSTGSHPRRNASWV